MAISSWLRSKRRNLINVEEVKKTYIQPKNKIIVHAFEDYEINDKQFRNLLEQKFGSVDCEISVNGVRKSILEWIYEIK